MFDSQTDTGRDTGADVGVLPGMTAVEWEAEDRLVFALMDTGVLEEARADEPPMLPADLDSWKPD